MQSPAAKWAEAVGTGHATSYWSDLCATAIMRSTL